MSMHLQLLGLSSCCRRGASAAHVALSVYTLCSNWELPIDTDLAQPVTAVLKDGVLCITFQKKKHDGAPWARIYISSTDSALATEQGQQEPI